MKVKENKSTLWTIRVTLQVHEKEKDLVQWIFQDQSKIKVHFFTLRLVLLGLELFCLGLKPI